MLEAGAVAARAAARKRTASPVCSACTVGIIVDVQYVQQCTVHSEHPSLWFRAVRVKTPTLRELEKRATKAGGRKLSRPSNVAAARHCNHAEKICYLRLMLHRGGVDFVDTRRIFFLSSYDVQLSSVVGTSASLSWQGSWLGRSPLSGDSGLKLSLTNASGDSQNYVLATFISKAIAWRGREGTSDFAPAGFIAYMQHCSTICEIVCILQRSVRCMETYPRFAWQPWPCGGLVVGGRRGAMDFLAWFCPRSESCIWSVELG